MNVKELIETLQKEYAEDDIIIAYKIMLMTDQITGIQYLRPASEDTDMKKLKNLVQQEFRRNFSDKALEEMN